MSDRVPFVHLGRQHAALRDEFHAAFERVVGSSGFILGEEVERFEQEFAAYCGVEHCVGVASGTAALTLALIAAGIEPGDEVVVPAHTYIASALGVLHAGATPVLCDVDPGTGLIDPQSASAAVSDRTAAILAVHLYGQVSDMRPLAALAERCGALLLEDAAQAHGAMYAGRRAGSLGTAAAFSFYPSKNLGALGDGGAICTDDAAIAERARQLRHIGQRRKGEHVVAGFNERLDGLQAALLRLKLPLLDGWNEARRRHAAVYRRLLGEAFHLLEERPESPCVYHLLPVRLGERDVVAARMSQAGVETAVHYDPALMDQPALAGRILMPHECPAARAWAEEELSLPMFAELWQGEVERAAAACLAASVEAA